MSIYDHAFQGNALKLKSIVDKKKSSSSRTTLVNALSPDRGNSALYTAARFGHLDCVRLLVDDYDADVNLVNSSSDKSTPLHGAAYGGHGDIVEYLLEKGTKASVKNAFGETAQDNAAQSPNASTSMKNRMKRMFESATRSRKRGRAEEEENKGNDEEPSPPPPPKSTAQKKKSETKKANDDAATLDWALLSSEEQPNTSTQINNNNNHARFYNEVARTRAFAKTVKRDAYGNVAGTIGDLGNDGAFTGWNMLILNTILFGVWAQEALRKKGWTLKIVIHEKDFVQEINKGIYDVAMIISNNLGSPHRKNLVESVLRHHDEGKGLLIAADNAPLFNQANSILGDRFGVTLTGDTPGDKVLVAGDPRVAGQFDATGHAITAGIEASIYEGVTICYPEGNLDEKVWTVFGQSSDDHPVLISTSDEYAGGEGKPGRIVIDCGFTKFFDLAAKAVATDRYLTNAVTWLANVERSEMSSAEQQRQNEQQ